MKMLGLFIVLPLLLAILNIQGMISREHTIYTMMIAVIALVYIKWLPATLDYIRSIGWTFSMKNITDYAKGTPQDPREEQSQWLNTRNLRDIAPAGYMGDELGWKDSVFGSASGGSNKEATIPRWTPPDAQFYGF